MAITNILDRVTKWVTDNICPEIFLKVPPDSEIDATDADYQYQRVNPVAFTMYVPTKEKLAPGIISPFPSVCVRFIEGADDIGDWKGSVGIQLCFSAWNPGVHGKDVLLPNPENGLKPCRWTGEEADAYFRRCGGGWRDVWNMTDIALRHIESVTNIDGLVIDRSVPVKFGPITEQEAIPDYYPFWFSWVSFTLQYPVLRHVEGSERFL